MIEQRFGAKLNGPGDELGLGVLVEGREETIPSGLPHIVTVESEPDQRMNTKSGVPRSVDDAVIKPILVACAVQAYVSALELGSDILEFTLESIGALTAGNCVRKPEETNLGLVVGPPAIERRRNTGGRLKPERWEAAVPIRGGGSGRVFC